MRRGGMTLLEIILAIGLIVAVAGGAMAFYRQTTEIRSRIEDELRRIESRSRIMGLITAELQRACRARQRGVDAEMGDPWLGMEGDGNEMAFPCATYVDYRRLWEPSLANEDSPTPQYDAPVVGYRLRIVTDDATNAEVIAGLERFTRPLPGSEAENTRLLSTDIRFMMVEYSQGSSWLPSWTGGDLPVGVRVTLGEKPLPPETEPADYPHPTFRRTVYLPGAFVNRRSTVIRGGPGRGG